MSTTPNADDWLHVFNDLGVVMGWPERTEPIQIPTDEALDRIYGTIDSRIPNMLREGARLRAAHRVNMERIVKQHTRKLMRWGYIYIGMITIGFLMVYLALTIARIRK